MASLNPATSLLLKKLFILMGLPLESIGSLTRKSRILMLIYFFSLYLSADFIKFSVLRDINIYKAILLFFYPFLFSIDSSSRMKLLTLNPHNLCNTIISMLYLTINVSILSVASYLQSMSILLPTPSSSGSSN